MGFWEELSSSTGSPTGSAVVEDPYARAVRLYEMELTNAAATAEARRGVAPNMGFDALTGSSFQLPPLNASTQGPARGARAFGDTEADIQREVMAPALQFGDEVMAPFQRGGGRRGVSAARPVAPIIRGSAASGYFSVDPVTGQTKDIREPTAQARRIEQLDMAEFNRAQRVLSQKAITPSQKAAQTEAQRIVEEIKAKYASTETAATSAPTASPQRGMGSVKFFNSEADELAGRSMGFQAGVVPPIQPNNFSPSIGDLRLSESNGVRVLNVRRKQ